MRTHREFGASELLTRLIILRCVQMDRLRETVKTLKNSTSDLELWHAYSTIMTALAPDPSAPEWEFKATLDALDLASSTGLAAGQARKASMLQGGQQHWFDAEKHT
jgi:hypothetical protein